MAAASCSEQTIDLRAYQLRRVARDLGGAPAQVTGEALIDWLAGQSWAPNTKRSYRATLRAFYRWMAETGRVARSPAHELPVVRVPRARPRPAPEAAFRWALRSSDDRARLAIMLAGTCGLRRGEIARARRDHLEEAIGGYVLRVIGKGGHERLVPLTDELAREILSRPAGWLFPSPKDGHLTPHHLGKIVSAHLPGKLTTHTLRHRCGTVALEATGGNLRAVQELLGHAKPETTAIYTEVPGSAIRRAVEGAA